MYRRIEFIHDQVFDRRGKVLLPPVKMGLMTSMDSETIDSWMDKLRGITHGHLPNNARFYFTELGWKEVGRGVITVAQKQKERYRIIVIKENSAEVCWRDRHTGYEVAVQPSKKKFRRA